MSLLGFLILLLIAAASWAPVRATGEEPAPAPKDPAPGPAPTMTMSKVIRSLTIPARGRTVRTTCRSI